MKLKLWLDDVRREPDESWYWARTLQAAKDFMLEHGKAVVECSLDHDLGFHEADPDDPDAMYLRGASPDGNGFDLVDWMIHHDLVPAKVTIHSWNVPAGVAMAARLNRYGYDCTIDLYKPPGLANL